MIAPAKAPLARDPAKSPRAKFRHPKQFELPLPYASSSWGGRRAGSGRKPAAGRRRVGHEARVAHHHAHPLHVVIRAKFRPLRSPFVFPTLRRALAKATRARVGFRIVHFSVQGDHLHLIVEADDKQTLSRGMQGLSIRVARQVNSLVGRAGRLWGDRFFARALTSPRAVKNAIAYVLNNFRKHNARTYSDARIDPYSSAPFFDGFAELRGRTPSKCAPSARLPLAPRGLSPPESPLDCPTVTPITWLARIGWRRAGSIALARPNP